MRRSDRMTNLKQAFSEITAVRSQIDRLITSGGAIGTGQTAALRLQITAIEHQIAIIRLCQSEDRLRSYLLRALIGLCGVGLGAAFGHQDQLRALLNR
jgi:hypothetical protein